LNIGEFRGFTSTKQRNPSTESLFLCKFTFTFIIAAVDNALLSYQSIKINYMKSIRISLIAAFLGALINFSSCKKDNPAPVIPTVKFTTAQASYGEDQGTIGVSVTLSAVQTSDVIVNYTWTSPDTSAFLGADFTFVTPGTMTIKAGQLTGSIGVNLIDDTQLDGDNNITLTLSATGSAASALSATKTDLAFALTITDNDVLPANDLQADLYWYGSNPFANITANTLYLVLQQNVVYHDTTTSDGTFAIIGSGLTDQGTPYNAFVANNPGYNTNGFQTVLLNATNDPDQKYFIFVPYVKGTGEVNFTLVLNGMGHTNDFANGTFSAADAPTSTQELFFYFGPFTKANGLFPYTPRVSTLPENLKLTKAKVNWEH
jgi:hypothetical protein